MSTVFISYARKDRAALQPVFEAVKASGLSVWFPDALPIGRSWQDLLDEGLKAAQCVILVWSKTAAQSEYVQLEIQRAIKAWSSDRLVLVTVDDTPLPIGLRDLSPLRIGNHQGTERDELVNRIRAVLPGELSGPIIHGTRQMPDPEEKDKSEQTPGVFVSYSHVDTSTVDQVVQRIEEIGFPVWIDRGSFGCQRYAGRIVRAIRASNFSRP